MKWFNFCLNSWMNGVLWGVEGPEKYLESESNSSGKWVSGKHFWPITPFLSCFWALRGPYSSHSGLSGALTLFSLGSQGSSLSSFCLSGPISNITVFCYFLAVQHRPNKCFLSFNESVFLFPFSGSQGPYPKSRFILFSFNCSPATNCNISLFHF